MRTVRLWTCITPSSRASKPPDGRSDRTSVMLIIVQPTCTCKATFDADASRNREPLVNQLAPASSHH
jgi:hypothetical protein